MSSDRKKDHITLAAASQTAMNTIDNRFNYEPLLSSHPEGTLKPFSFLGKTMRLPIWISSMTGGTKEALNINQNLAKAAREFGMGMGLGSGRILLEDDRYPEHFMLRSIIGNEVPLYANLGIAQIEKAILARNLDPIQRMVQKLEVDGLIIHVNPLQEWIQPEGDRLKEQPIDMISEFVTQVEFPVIVKEVGQGMGPKSLQELLKLPIQAIDFAAYGGTNFARLEQLRKANAEIPLIEPLVRVGHGAEEMLNLLNGLVENNTENLVKEVIISGGIGTFLDGYYFIKKSQLPAIYGQASAFLNQARGDYLNLKKFVQSQAKGLELAFSYLQLK